jgi:hypothetical protein
MNTKQQRFALGGLAVAAVMIAVPPWQVTNTRTQVERSVFRTERGWDTINSAPVVIKSSQDYGYAPLWDSPVSSEARSYSLDFGRLGLQFGGLAIVLAAGLLILKNGGSAPHNNAGR